MAEKTTKTLDDLIKSSGLKKNAIAERMGITPNYLWRLMQEPKNMNLTYVEQLADILQVEINDVVEAIRESGE